MYICCWFNQLQLSIEKIKKQLGDNIIYHRKKVNMTQEDLSFISDVDRKYIHMIEKGISNPSIEIIYKISESLNVDFKDLLS